MIPATNALSIDWIAYTYKFSDSEPAREYFTNTSTSDIERYHLWEAYISDVAQTEFGAWVEDSGMFGYEYGASHESGVRVLWSSDLRMGIHVIFPGRALSGRDAISIIQKAWAVGAQFTRIDVCFDDVSDGVTSVAEYAKRYAAGDFEGRARSYREITSSGGGHTLYIGSRQSEKMMRIYDKGAEQGIASGFWVRHEIELKGGAACGVAQYIGFYAGETLDLGGVITDFVKFPATTVYERLGDAKVEIRSSGKGERKTAEWGLTAIAAIARQMTLDTGYAREIETAFSKAGFEVTIRDRRRSAAT